MKRVKLKVHGIVQGVGFRWFAKRRADRLGIVGYVKNLADGTVEIEAQGKPDTLNEFIETIRKGPPLGMVSKVDVEELPPVNSYADFEIRF